MLHIVKGMSIFAVIAGICLSACLACGADRQIEGAGATFPEPFYHKIFDVYYRQHGWKVNYQGVGSGAGIRSLMAKKTDFAGSDIGVTGQGTEDGSATAPLVRVPTCLGAVAIIYNLPDNPKIRFTSGILTDIFLGNISKWNDPKLTAVNPGIRLPDLVINIIHRSDESGTTFIFTDFLSKTDGQWRKTMGGGKSRLHWPVGQGAKGNPGLAGMVKQVTGAIGYVELTYAVANGMTFGSVQNRSEKFVDPSPGTVAAAASSAAPWDNGSSLTDTPQPDGYPISGFTWIVVFKEQSYSGRSRETAEELVRMLYWVTHEGQKHAPPLRYVPLPKGVVKKAESILKSVTYNGAPLLKKKP